MNRKRFSSKAARPSGDEVYDEDAVDPAEFFRPARKRKGNHRKAQQLCQQVAQTLSLVLSGEFGQELGELRIVAVSPAPDTSQLLVLVAAAVSGQQLDVGALHARLAAVEGRLRAEVAAAITRRRAPRLLFQFVAVSPDDEVQP